VEVAASGADAARGVLIKVDVEGYEKEVLEGAKSTLAGTSWWRGLIEFSPSALAEGGKSVEAEWEYFRQFAGIVVAGGAVDAVEISGARLPESPPVGDVDLLIGAGALPCGRGV
jgi:hypothetical protein